jgi:predicted nucleic acid-binding protein
MTGLVADTSALASLGIVADADPDPLSCCLADYEVSVPEAVVAELREMASYDDPHGRAADAVLARTSDFAVRPVALDAGFPLDDGENAAVTLANELDAGLLLCDEFNSLGLVHASLADTRLVTTPTLLSVLVRNERLTAGEALALLDDISDARSWETNSYVQQARSLLEDP